MEGVFYRPKGNVFKNFLKNIKKNRRRALLLAVAVIGILYLLLDNKGVIQRVRLELRKQEMTETVEAAKLETKRLKSRIKALEGDKKTVEKLAREKYGMAREGETVYRVKKD